MAKGFVKKHWKKLLILGVVALAIVLFVRSKTAQKEIKTETIKKGTVREELILTGEIDATYYAKLAFETGGKIVYVGVKEGDKAVRGKLLAKLDTTILNSSYQQALASLRTEEATVANIRDQVKNHSTDETYAQKDTRTTAEAAKDSAYESVIQAKRSLDGASIFAPFNGIVTFVANPFSGVNVLATQTQIEIIDPSSMFFEVQADQTEVTGIFPGQTVEIVLDAFDDKTFKGIVEMVGFAPLGGDAGSSYTVKVKFDGVDLESSRFKIGMSGDAKFVTNEKSNAFYVPSDFVNTDKDGKFVKVSPKGEKKYVEVGLEGEEFTEIIGDFEEGDAVYD